MTEPWGLSGPQFFWLYLVGYVISVLMVFGIRATLSRTGARGVSVEGRLDVYQAAFLAGGPERVVNTAIARLALSGRVLVARDGKLTVAAGSTEVGEMEDVVAEAVHLSGSRAELYKRLRNHPRVSAIGDQLRADGLLLDDMRVKLVRAAAFLPCIVWFIGVLRALNGVALHRPVSALGSWLGITLLVTWGVAVTIWVATDHCPSADGRRALCAVREQYEQHQAALGGQAIDPWSQFAGVAVLGFAAVADPELRAALGKSAVGGDGGGCGGGCGGCGGCGG